MKQEISLSPDLASLQTKLVDYLFSVQKQGHWHFKLDDNITLSSEYVMFLLWMGLSTHPHLPKLKNHLLKTQLENGAWNLFYGGAGNLSATIEAYTALRLLGVDIENEALAKARAYILENGGIAKARVFTKIWLALFDLYPWRGIPMIPPELLFAPRQLPFHILEFSYWSRTVIIPLTILFHYQKVRQLSFNVDELYCHAEEKTDPRYLRPQAVDDSWIIETRWKFSWINWELFFLALNKGVALYESRSPIKPLRKLALQRARQWILSHQEESGDWGGIIPAMMNSVMALWAMGMDLENPVLKKGLAAIEAFCREEGDAAILQSCVSPIWDTGLACLALLDAGVPADDPRLQEAKDFLWENRITTIGDWVHKTKYKKGREIAAWCFQYHNAQYPDIDDSAVVLLALHRLGMSAQELEPALYWLEIMQSSDGGWAAFDRDNNQWILNQIPFADLKSLIDPSSADVTGHVLETLGTMGLGQSLVARKGVRYLKRSQKENGSWFGRWGVNYLYGTSAAVIGLRRCGEPSNSPVIQKALQFMMERQNPDGGFGEACESYESEPFHGRGLSTASQTAWVLMALSECQESANDFANVISRAVSFLKTVQKEDGSFEEPQSTGTGFPVHFYLRYDGYRSYFPLMALGRLNKS